MTKDLTLEKKIIGAIGAFLFISPNLNIPESILTYCGIENHDVVRFISIGLFALIDLTLGILFLKSRPGKREYLILAVFNVIYMLPLLPRFDVTELMQYISFVVPVTIFAVKLSKDDIVKESFLKGLRIATKVLFVLAIIYIILQYVSTNRDYRGVVIINNMTYGDMGYLFLTGFVMSAFDCTEKRIIPGLLGIVVFSLAVLFSGSRSAFLCTIFTVVLWIILTFLNRKTSREDKKRFSIGIVVIVVTFVIGILTIPSGSRLNYFNVDFTNTNFSIKNIIFETKEAGDNDILVIYAPTNESVYISQLYEREIVNSDNTVYSTVEWLRDDVKSNKNEVIILKSEDDREFAEQYRPLFHRTFLWRMAIEEFKKHPLAGNGPCYYKNKYDGYFPHNILLESMADFGLVGLAGVVVLWLYCFIKGLYYYRNGNSTYGFLFIVLLFSHIPRYLLYTTIYSNTTIAMTVVLFVTIGELTKDISNKQEEKIKEERCLYESN